MEFYNKTEKNTLLSVLNWKTAVCPLTVTLLGPPLVTPNTTMLVSFMSAV